ncbi:MAG: T9SS type A sorting domain-containing protein [Bacteroidetes bacterium]|nr:T9SS type A sorting domain-containing protein [Bacteroidota bacterium]
MPYNGYNYTINAGAAYSPASYTSRIVTSGYSSNMGSSNQLPNGNTLICVATTGLIYEVNAAGTTLWSKTISGSVPQAHRYSTCYITGAPATPLVSQLGDTLYSTTSTSYQWYTNGTPIVGATNQNYVPTQAGLYQVVITNANGCDSDTSLSFNFIPTGIFDLAHAADFTVFPNPTSSSITLDLSNYSTTNFVIQVYSSLGELVLNEKNKTTLDLSFVSNGMYSLLLQRENQPTLTKRISVLK